MAPKKRAVKQEDEPAPAPSTAPVKPVSTSTRVTRSSARSAANVKVESPADEIEPELPKNKKAKRAQKDNGDIKKEKEIEKAEEEVDDEAKGKTIVIEHCKQCQSFKTRAIQVQNGLENGVSGITVLINPEKPRRGCFEIRTEGGEKFISLLNMSRPFTRMKKLDMEQVISDIIEKIKG